MICLLGLNRRNIATTFKYLLKNERWQCSLLICKDRIRIKFRMSLGSAIDYLCRIICHYGMICHIWESVSPLMTPQPLMSPLPYQYRAGSALHQAKRAMHRALGIERTAGVGSSGGLGFERTAQCIASTVSGPRASGIEWTARRPRALHHMDPVRCLARGQRLRVCGARSLSARRVGRARYRADHGSQRTPRDCRHGIV